MGTFDIINQAPENFHFIGGNNYEIASRGILGVDGLGDCGLALTLYNAKKRVGGISSIITR